MAMPSSAEMTVQQRAYNDREIAKTSDPDSKKFWQNANDCLAQHQMVLEDAKPDATSPYMSCVREKEGEQIAELEQRAANESDPSKRDHHLKVASCIDRVKRTMGFLPYRSLEECAAKTELSTKDNEVLTAKNDYADAEKAGTAKAWIAFLAKHPNDKRAPEVMQRVLTVSNAAPPDEQAELDDSLVKAYPAALKDVPAERRLLMVGPAGLRVRDVRKMTEAKIASSIIVARIKAATAPFKNFDGDELMLLKKMGISDEAVTAMIEVSAKLEDRQKADDERKALRAELESLRKLIEEKKASGAKSSGKTVQTKEGPLDVLESCAKRLAAMKLCDQLPFPASNVCQSTTDSEFPCPDH